MDKVARAAKIRAVAQAFKQSNPTLLGTHIKVVEVGPRDGLQN